MLDGGARAAGAERRAALRSGAGRAVACDLHHAAPGSDRAGQ